MKVRRRGIRRYLCWLCEKDLKITTPPYQRGLHNVCRCEEQRLPGGSLTPPRGWSEEDIKRARETLLQQG